MAKADKLVTWCLNKAKREIEKDGKHRGLVKKQPNHKLAIQHIEKAEHNLNVFFLNKENKFYDWCINIGFYVMYHCCLAILAKYGYESRNQECTFAFIEKMIDDEIIEEAFRKYIEAIKYQPNEKTQIMPMREKYQYTPIVDIDVQKVEELLELCQDIVKDTKGIIES